MDMKYICRGDDHEDLTEKVLAAIKSNPCAYSAKIQIRRMWRVKIKCSQGHENIFIGELYSGGGDYISEKKVD
jgi:hypothetical protein